MTQTKAQLIDGKSATIQFTGGSASAPAISFTGDTNTGIYSPGADQVAISTNGTGRLFVDANGQIAAGGSLDASISVDTRVLKVGGLNYLAGTNGTSGKQNFKTGLFYNALPTSSASANAIVSNAGGDYLPARYTMFQGTHTWETATSATAGSAITWFERMRITNDGKLGLGTSSADNKLSVGISAADEGIELKATYNGSRVARFGLVNPGVDNTPYIGSVAGNDFGFITSNVRRMTLDASGRLGVGTTTPSQKLTVGAGSETGSHFVRVNGANSDIYIGQSAGTVFGVATGGINFIGSDASVPFGLGCTVNQPLIFGTNNAERARIDTSGRLLVGTSTSVNTAALGNAQVQVVGTTNETSQLAISRFSNDADRGRLVFIKSRGSSGTNTIVQADDAVGRIEFLAADGSSSTAYPVAAHIGVFVDGTPGANDMPGRLVFSTCADGASSPTERMRIRNNGDLRIYGDNGINIASASSAGTSSTLIDGFYSATGTGTGTRSFIVYTNGNVLNTNNTYGQLSDAKLKEKVVDASSQWADLKAIEVKNFHFIGDATRQLGVIAQQVEQVSPGLVDESPDRDEEGNDLGTVTKSVKYSVLYLKAVKALQEAMERIEALEAKVAALESA